MRVDKAFPAIISKAQFPPRQQADALPRTQDQPSRRVGAPTCSADWSSARPANRALSGQDSKSGQFSYYVCQSLMKRGSGACDTPRLNARRFEELVRR